MKFKYLLLFCLMLGLTSCSRFLEVEPRDQQTAAQLYSTKSGFYMSSTGIYDGLASNALYGRTMSYEAIDLFGKRYLPLTNNTYLTNFATLNFTFPAVETSLSNAWRQSYSLILASNILMDNISSQNGILTSIEANTLKGEMLAARAFLHFDMLRLFGPRWNNNPKALSIPYNEKSVAEVLPLLPFEEVISKILRDLDNAEKLLAADPVIDRGALASISTTESVQLRFRQFKFNYYAVIALKARVYLWTGKKAEALAAAKLLLNDPVVNQHFPAVDPNKLLANFTNPDRIFSTEVLAGIYTQTRDEAYKRYFSSETAGTSFLQPFDRHIGNLFSEGFSQTGGSETQDYRYQSQWEAATGVGIKGNIFTKYKPIDATSDYYYAKMIPLIKLSEVYYIAAECEPNQADGFEWLNKMRVRRGLVPFTSARITTLTAQNRMTLYLSNEYTREFYGEGQAFFFYKRLAYQLTYENGQALVAFTYSDANSRAPLPVGELK